MRKENINDNNAHLLPEWLYNMERKLDDCNHLMEMLRTVLALCTLTLQIVILLKLFNII